VDTDCIFCKHAKNKNIKIWENDLFFSIFDPFPVTPGHSTIIPKRHVVDILGLTDNEWVVLGKVIKEIIHLIERSDLKKIYTKMIEKAESDISKWFLNKAINHPRINTKPDAYNHGINDGRAAGRTFDHLHWHIIPRFSGDMIDPRGGVRYVIPDMGNYKIQRNEKK